MKRVTSTPVELAAVAAAVALGLTMVAGLLVPIYTDEVAWLMMLGRSPLDGGVDRQLTDACGAATLRAAPFFMQPLRHLTAWTWQALPDPRAIRIGGVLVALGWGSLMWTLGGRLPADRRAVGRALALSAVGLGVLPFLMVWGRPEGPLLLILSAAVLLAWLGRHAAAPIPAIAPALLVLGLAMLGVHPKAVVFMPVLLAATVFAGRGQAGRWPRLAVVAVLVAATAVAYRYWSARFACPGDPIIAAKIATENVAGAMAGLSPAALLDVLIRSADPTGYVAQAAPDAVPMSLWLPANVIDPALLPAWRWTVKAAWRILIWGLPLLIAIGAWRTRLRASAPWIATAILGSVLLWGATQINKNAYESALVLPLLAMALLLAMAALPAALIRPVGGLAIGLAVLGCASQLLLIGTYVPLLARRTAAGFGPIPDQPYSYTAWGYGRGREQMRAAAALCGIDPARSRHLLIDDSSYFVASPGWRPDHRMAVLGPWRGRIADPMAFLRATRSSGVLMACDYLPADLRGRAGRAGRYCCVKP